jgi:hypothetical protein
MATGAARRLRLNHLADLASVIGTMRSNEAITLGALRSDLRDTVQIVTKNKLIEALPPDAIARTADCITYRPDQAGIVLLDHDTKGMPDGVKRKLAELGGFWPALLTILPELQHVGSVSRASTSAGLFRTDTGEKVPGSDGRHVFVAIMNCTDAERFLKQLHWRCWLAGFGWMVVSSGGQLLEKSIVDRMVGGPERIVFEGAPVLIPPLAQDEEARRPVVIEGGMLDTIASCPPLSLVEQARFRELRTKEMHRLKSEASKARENFISRRSKQLVERTSISAEAARGIIERQCSGILLPNVVLVFDEDDLAGATVGEVLADPDRFDGTTLADPLEGLSYGRCKAKIMRRPNGTVYIHSFAHGRTIYELKLDASSCRAAVEKAEREEAVEVFIRSACVNCHSSGLKLRQRGCHHSCASAEPINRPEQQHVEATPTGVIQHGVEAWAAIAPLGAADAVVLVDRDNRPPSALRNRLQHASLVLHGLAVRRNPQIQRCPFCLAHYSLHVPQT